MRRTRGRGFFTLAVVAGLLHAAPSLYWALGGTWLLETVGQFAVDLRAEGAASTTVLLLAITALTAAGVAASQGAPRIAGVAQPPRPSVGSGGRGVRTARPPRRRSRSWRTTTRTPPPPTS